MFFKSKGYKVKIKGRSGVIYEEGKRKLFISAEMMTGAIDLVIYVSSMQSWKAPFNGTLLTVDDKKRIKFNISQELKSKGLRIEWE